MGMVFQNYAIWPHMSVFDNVAFGLKLARLGRAEIGERVARVLAAVGLEGLEGRHPAQLSGGQQQRVALARSLVVEPSILLLDEPLSNLDAKLRERMRGELKSLQRRTGITFVYVTHDQAEAMALSDRIAVFHQGVLQQYGRPREIYERPANLFVADFMGIVNRLPGEIVERRDGQVRVRVGDHVLAAVGPAADASPAREVTLAIRPESVRLGATADRRPGQPPRRQRGRGHLPRQHRRLPDRRRRAPAPGPGRPPRRSRRSAAGSSSASRSRSASRCRRRPEIGLWSTAAPAVDHRPP